MDIAAEISISLTAAVIRIFETMGSLAVTLAESTDVSQRPSDALQDVTGNVSFAGPSIAGVIYLSLPSSLARLVTGTITGDPASVTEQEENDILGEFTNMVTGNVKTHMADKGYNSQLSIPNVLRGTKLSVSCKGFSLAHAFTFRVSKTGETFQVLALVKAD